MIDPFTDTRHTAEAMVNGLDAKAALETAHGWTFGAVAGLLIGYSIRETAAKLGIPATTLTRLLRKLGKEASA